MSRAGLAPIQANIQVPTGGKVVQDYIALPAQPKDKWSLSDFNILQRLGSGQYGQVYLASVKGVNFLVALKKMSITKMVEFGVMSQVRREVEIAFNTRHPNLLRTFGYFYDQNDLYLILEPCLNGMLYAELSKVKRYQPQKAAKYVAQLCEALLYLHNHHILHRDIKPENLLLDHDNNVKLADFGWSIHDPKDGSRRKTTCGTPEYFPPEIVERQPYNGSADIWCVGIFCYELLVGETPFRATEVDDICKNVSRLEYAVPENVCPEGKDFINAILVRDVTKRPTLSRLLAHPFLVKYYYEPNRISPPAGKRARQE